MGALWAGIKYSKKIEHNRVLAIMLNFCSPIGECILSRRLFGDSDVVFLGKGDDAFFGPVDSTADFDQWLLF